MMEIPQSRAQSHASSRRLGGGGLSGIKVEYSVRESRWYRMSEPLFRRVRTKARVEKEREQRWWK